jgi:hypothetical protein
LDLPLAMALVRAEWKDSQGGLIPRP